MMAGERPAELRLAPESIEALAVRLAQILGGVPEADPDGMISAGRVAELWGVRRPWVYEHREELGGFPLGDGPRPRIRFDPLVVEERLGAPRGDGRRRPVVRRSTWINATRRSDSLSPRTRANVGRREDLASGKAGGGPPDAAPDGGRSD